MDNDSLTRISIIPTLSLIFTALLILPVTASAQRGTPTGVSGPSPSGAGVRDSPKPPSIRERQFKISEMEREAATPRTPEEERLAMAQIAEDFEQIQVINNKMMGDTMRAASPNYARIVETTAEIKKRAARLRDNLRLAQVEDPEEAKRSKPAKLEPGQIKANLLVLDGSIMSFIKNPIFKSPRVVNVEQAVKARQDVEAVIQLSEWIKKDAQRLKQVSGKTAEKPD